MLPKYIIVLLILSLCALGFFVYHSRKKPQKDFFSFTGKYQDDKVVDRMIIESILNQTHPPDLIRINIPKIFKRTQQSYDNIPRFLIGNPKIQLIQYEEDMGPIMKFLPTFLDYPNADIICVDDDVLMMPKTIETFLKYLKINPHHVYCFSGFHFDSNGNWNRTNGASSFVNIAEGYMAVYYSNSVIQKFKSSSLSLLDYYKIFSKNEYCFTSDDLMMSNYIALNNLSIYKIYDNEANFDQWWQSGCELSYGKSGDGIMHLGQDQHFTRYNKAYQHLINNRINYIK